MCTQGSKVFLEPLNKDHVAQIEGRKKKEKEGNQELKHKSCWIGKD